jgi:EF-P beta-lysylation protein EpmB
MIAEPLISRQPAAWQRALAEAVCDRARLLELVGLDEARFRAAHGEPAADGPLAQGFPLRVPLGFVRRMRQGDTHDPLLLQVLPRAAEDLPAPAALVDPVGDRAAEVLPGLLHKYAHRVLLVLTGACAVHCRYCFRRNFPYAEAQATPARLEAALAWIAAREDVHEVILSGGDPFSLSDARLGALAERLAAMPQIRRLRIHTRLPIVLPERVDAALLAWLGATRLAKVVVLHANHARELDEAVARACRALAATGALLLNQAVLLAGVNDTLAAQRELAERLLDCGVFPYYLHALDRARGATHFEVPAAEARALMQGLRERLPGYLVPRHVVEVAGAASKLEVR